MPITVTVPFSYWHQSAFTAEIEDSFARESERMAADDEAEHGERALDAEDIEGILRDLVNEDAVLDAADDDYVCGFAHAVSAEAKFEVELKKRNRDAKGARRRLIDRDAARRLASGEAADDDELASAVEVRFEEWLDEESFKLAILDYVACSTDALMCDRLLNMREFGKRIRRMRREKHGPPDRAPRRKHARARPRISGQGELSLVAKPTGKPD